MECYGDSKIYAGVDSEAWSFFPGDEKPADSLAAFASGITAGKAYAEPARLAGNGAARLGIPGAF